MIRTLIFLAHGTRLSTRLWRGCGRETRTIKSGKLSGQTLCLGGWTRCGVEGTAAGRSYSGYTDRRFDGKISATKRPSSRGPYPSESCDLFAFPHNCAVFGTLIRKAA